MRSSAPLGCLVEGFRAMPGPFCVLYPLPLYLIRFEYLLLVLRIPSLNMQVTCLLGIPVTPQT